MNDGEFDLLDIVADNDGPSLQKFRSSDAPEARLDAEEEEPHTPLQLLRRASQSVTESILSPLMEPEKQNLLGTKAMEQRPQPRPLPPPRGHNPLQGSSFKERRATAAAALKSGANSYTNKALGQSDNMTQYDIPNPTTTTSTTGTRNSETVRQSDPRQQPPPPSAPPHTKLDIQKFTEDYNNGPSGDGISGRECGGGGGSGDVVGDAATIILTPTSLNFTNTTQNVNSGSGGGSGNDNNTGSNNNNNRSFVCTGVRDVDYKGPKWWRRLALHWSLVSEHVALFVIFVVAWAMAWVLLPDYAEPQTSIMRIAFLVAGAQLSGILVSLLHLPDMLGMLFFGVIYANIGLAKFEGYQKFELFLREMALINIMLLAGLGLDGRAFKELWLMILRLSLIPTIAEVGVVATLAYFTLKMPWLWGIALGLVITAVSPNVVVTVMLKLKEERLGLNSGIHTLIYAMTTCNDVISIFMFGVIISIIFSTNSLTQQVLQGPIGIGIGLVFGYLYGMMLQYLPSRNAVYANGLRFVLTILGGSIAVMGSRVIGYTSAGALGCVTTAFIAGIGWKREERKLTPQQLQAYQTDSVPKRLDLLWKFLKPVSFALIGKEINFAVLDGRVIGYGALLVLLGSLFRLAFAYLSTYGGNLSRKERAYITISGFPKATVQAALGPVALDFARAAAAAASTVTATEIEIALASNVLIISVLAIIFTAPLGAILMLRLAPIWLKHGDAVDTGESLNTLQTVSTPDALNNTADSPPPPLPQPQSAPPLYPHKDE